MTASLPWIESLWVPRSLLQPTMVKETKAKAEASKSGAERTGRVAGLIIEGLG